MFIIPQDITEVPQDVVNAIDSLTTVEAWAIAIVCLVLGLMSPVSRFHHNWRVSAEHPEHRVQGTKTGLVWTVVMVVIAVGVLGGAKLMLDLGKLIAGLIAGV